MDENDNKMYLIVMIVNTSGIDMTSDEFWESPGMLGSISDEDWEKWLNGQSAEPVALYSEFDDASHWAQELTDQLLGTADEDDVQFEIFELEVDREGPPQLLSDLRSEEETLQRTVEEILVKLMKQGFVDQLIGEDGRFYYVMTDEGKVMLDDMPQHIKDYFKDKE